MTIQQNIADTIAGASSPLNLLLRDAILIGGIYHLGYRETTIVTNDAYKRQAGGIPQFSFVLAAAVDPTQPDRSRIDDDEVVLLRVKDVADLPNQRELIDTKFTAMRDAVDRGQRPTDPSILDPWTQNELQNSGFACEVLGTFFVDRAGGRSFANFGSDMDNVYSSARYFVFSPSATALEFIASYPEITGDEIEAGTSPRLIEIGKVRFSSTKRRAAQSGRDQVPVRIRVEDFISRKTAVLGMTRAGKSNTNKTLVTAIHEHSKLTRQPVGQVIFDPQGEYASVNDQDGTALRLLGDPDSEDVIIYKVRPDVNVPQERHLTINFYDINDLTMAQEMVNEFTGPVSAGYADAFRAAEIHDPSPADYPLGTNDLAYQRDLTHASKGRFAFYCLLAKAQFRAPLGITVSMAADMRDAINASIDGVSVEPAQRGYSQVRGTDLREVMDWICARVAQANTANQDRIIHEHDGVQFRVDMTAWRREGTPFTAIRKAYDMSGGSAIFNRIRGRYEFHNPNSRGQLVQTIVALLNRGSIVIVDLSVGSERVAQVMSERIVNGILDDANARFRDPGRDNIPMQIVVEEAHNLFDRNKANQDERDPWVRLAKESAKYRIGLLYATQEVTSVDKRILSNTSNWAIAHLNSDVETGELAHYYDFRTFAEDLRRSEDPGFARLKTYSGKYIVSVQVALFNHSMINRARAAAGLSPVTVTGQVVASVPSQAPARY